MSSLEKTIKIIKRNATEPSVDQPQVLLKTTKQTRREMAKVVTSWIEERRQAHVEISAVLFHPSQQQESALGVSGRPIPCELGHPIAILKQTTCLKLPSQINPVIPVIFTSNGEFDC